MRKYDPAKIEKKWQKDWARKKLYRTSDSSKKPKFYILDMFPYPSGEGLHVGHPKGYIATDIISRMKRMQGFNVLHPMGFDAFGLPAENYALKTKTHPEVAVKKNIARYKRQLEMIGLDYDWSREVNTTDPKFYKWTQWIFLKLLEKGLAYESNEPVNWCPTDKTVLANEDVENGRCERCGTLVEKRPMRQWVLKITDYADRLLQDLDARISECGTALITGPVDEPTFEQIEEPGTARKDLPYVERNAICAIVKHWSEDKYIGLKWKKVAWRTLITGGPEGDESAEEGAKKEIIEETGYRNPKFIKKLGLMHTKFFHVPKNVNRLAHMDIFYFELQNGERDDLSAEEQEIHEVEWLSRNEMRKFLTPASHIYAWDKFLNPDIKEIPGAKPLLNWPESIKESQRNWIGRSEGAIIKFEVQSTKSEIEVFTTRADTLFGATYLVLAPEHPFVKEQIQNPKLQITNKFEIQNYINEAKKRTEIERTDVKKEKTGVELKGLKAINPATKEEIPIWIADYVLPDYGTGAIMAVPAHDDRDFHFALKYSLPISQVIEKPLGIGYFFATIHDEDKSVFPKFLRSIAESSEAVAPTIRMYKINSSKSDQVLSYISTDEEKRRIQQGTNFVVQTANDKSELIFADVFTGDGVHINSNFLNGLNNKDAIEKITHWLEEKKIGIRKVVYKLKDWVFSRQRYWGEPIPVLKDPESGEVIPVREKDLPIKLPKVKSYEPTGTGESPLANIEKWVTVKTGKKILRRETNTMPQWAGSSWYYLRYMDPKNDRSLVGPKKESYWNMVDFYVGGAEHATRHLIYARFWHKFLYDIGVVSTKEPFRKLQSVGLIMGPDGKKMSKRFGNVINPDEIIKTWGADSLRLYEMFMGPFADAIAWNTDNMIGVRRFLEKVWRLESRVAKRKTQVKQVSFAPSDQRLETLLYKTVKKVTEDIESMSFNTAISSMMILVNEVESQKSYLPAGTANVESKFYEILLKLLAPFAPHMVEELWRELGNKGGIHTAEWPGFNENKIKEERVNIAVGVNGKVRAIVEIEHDAPESKVKNAALALPEMKKWIENKKIKRVVFVPGRVINFLI